MPRFDRVLKFRYRFPALHESTGILSSQPKTKLLDDPLALRIPGRGTGCRNVFALGYNTETVIEAEIVLS